MRNVPRPTRRQWLIITAAVVGILLIGGVAVAGALALRFDGGVDRVEVAGLNGATEGGSGGKTSGAADDSGEIAIPSPDVEADDASPLPDPVDEVVTVLVVASDDRSVLTEEEQAELGTGDVPGERTEAIALARLDPDEQRIDVLRIPRDSVVEHCDGTTGRINAAYPRGEAIDVGGATCLVETINGWTGIAPDHFVKVDFRGFVDIVDAVGGVEMWMDEPIQDDDANLDVGQGCQRFDGQDALAFARARSIDNDFGRIARQQRLVEELRDEVVSGSTAANPRRLVALIDAAADALEVDESMTLARMRELAVAAMRIPGDNIHTATVPGTIASEPPYVLHVDDADVARLSEALEQGRLDEKVPSDEHADGSEAPGEAGDGAPSDDEPADAPEDDDDGPEFVGVDRGPGCD